MGSDIYVYRMLADEFLRWAAKRGHEDEVCQVVTEERRSHDPDDTIWGRICTRLPALTAAFYRAKN